MALYWRRYSIGDMDFSYGVEIIEHLQNLVYERVPFSKIIEFADSKKRKEKK